MIAFKYRMQHTGPWHCCVCSGKLVRIVLTGLFFLAETHFTILKDPYREERQRDGIQMQPQYIVDQDALLFLACMRSCFVLVSFVVVLVCGDSLL